MIPSSAVLDAVLRQYGLDGKKFSVTPIGSGYIHLTFLLSGGRKLILQRVNKNVFNQPEIIASNLKLAADHIHARYPQYPFLKAIPTIIGKQMAYDKEGFPWRLFPYFDNTYTTDKVENTTQAYSAAAEFARLVRYLDDAPVQHFQATIARFHDLSWRYEQFEQSLLNPVKERFSNARDIVKTAESFRYLVDEYLRLIASGEMKLRVTHNDTKINNILFDRTSHQAVCAIDLDTLMPGYVMYDIGDMIRTFVSPVDEEERDLDKVVVRPEIYRAIVDGYLSQMGDRLSTTERKAIPCSGMMMTYIMALRMLTDYLNGDVYYKITYNEQNIIRAKNQFKLLSLLKENWSE